MKYLFSNKPDTGQFSLLVNETQLERYPASKTPDGSQYTILWNRGATQTVLVDEVYYKFEANAVLPIMMRQSFRLESPETVVAWQFNREFYCIVDHDAEVGCVGFVFYGPSPTMFVHLDADQVQVMQGLLQVFEKEFSDEEVNKGDMLRLLLVRLIILITRQAKKQYLGAYEIREDRFKLVRKFHLLVERHYKKEHQVQFYAAALNRSPKTISNIFSTYSPKTPIQVIQDRIIMEAKRLLLYSDKTIKEVADELGFTDPAHFSSFFKQHTSQSPTAIKKMLKPS